MELIQLIVLSFVQGISEFLPISSSAHLVLITKFFNWSDQGIAFDVFVHFGTLVAVCFYYRSFLLRVIFDCYYSVKEKTINPNTKLFFGIVIMTIPVGLVGLVYNDYIEQNLRNIQIIALASIFFAIFLAFAFIYHKRFKVTENISYLGFLIMGIFQIFALIPGASRSGLIITLALLLKVSYQMSLKVAFLSAIPVIIMSFVLKLPELLESSNIDYISMIIAFFISFLVAYFTIAYFIKLVEKIGMLPFVYYRLFLGFLLLLF